jgi:hypothetical protein
VNTERLIDVLSANLEAVAPGQVRKTLALALVTGVAAAFGLMLVTVGPRPEIYMVPHLEWLALKLSFALSLIIAGTPSLIRSMRPEPNDGTRFTLVFIPFLVVSAIAIATLLLARPDAWREMLRGATSVSWARCCLCILFFAAIPLAVLIWALRTGAPTRLKHSGAVAGIVAGAAGAAAYAFNCSSDSVPFVAFWYGGAIALCAFIGAQLGPLLLRW